LTYKAKDEAIKVVEDFNFEAPKTKDYLNFLNGLNVADHKTLLVLPEVHDNVVLSARNLPHAKVVQAHTLNTYDILNAEQVIICEGSVEKIVSNF
jgi:large subunit ribosomal protein L4